MNDACGHLTDTTIARHSQMIGVEKGLRNASVRVVMVHSKTTTDRQKDVIELVRLIHNENLFTNKPGHGGQLVQKHCSDKF